MKIAFFVGAFFPKPGGVQIQTHNIANTVIKLGNDIDFFLLNKTDIKKNLYNLVIINKFIISFFYYLDCYFKINLSFFLRIYFKYFLKIDKYDLFHFHFLNHKMIYIIKNLKYFDKKIIVTFHGADIQFSKKINYGFRLNKYYERSLRDVIFKIDFFHAISKSIKKDIIKLGVNKKKIFLLPNTVSLDKIKKFKNLTKNIKKKIYIITVTRFAKTTKGLDLVPKIAETLFKNNINYKWTFVGKNVHKIKHFNNMKLYKKNFQFYENIQKFNEYILPNNDLIKIYKKNHIYVSLSRIEAFGLTLLEALACQLPILSFNTKGVNELVVDDLNGKLVNKFSAVSMAESITKYQINGDYKIHKKNTLKSVLKFDLNKISKLIIKNYQKLI